MIFIAGDDPGANDEIATVAAGAGFAPVVLGDLATGGAAQQFPGGALPTLNLIQL